MSRLAYAPTAVIGQDALSVGGGVKILLARGFENVGPNGWQLAFENAHQNLPVKSIQRPDQFYV